MTGTGAMAENRRRAGMSTPPVTGESSLKYFIDNLAAVKSAPHQERILLVHNVTLTQKDVDAAKEAMANPYWAICPLSNKFIHNALPPVDLMRSNNLAICLGTDSLSSNDDLDMVAELYCLQEAFPHVPFEEMLLWACRNGASFLGKDDILGSMEKGKRPGIVLVNGLDDNGRLTDESRSERLI
jgi:cytosine/adenosine deaminase-related metal-dependent hydrolase